MEATMSFRKLFSVLFLMLFIISAGAGCGGGNSMTSSASPADSPPAGGGNTGGGSGGTTTGTATLAWSAPTTNTDGTPLTDLAGYKVHYGKSSGTYTNTVTIGKATSYSINNLAPGTYYFTVTAYDTTGLESGYSNEVAKTIM
jgi:hypothetical protein